MTSDSELKQKSLKTSYFKGLFGCGMTGFIQEYLTPFILFLGGGAFHIGFFNAMSNLSASLIQLFSAESVQWLKSRKAMISLCIIIQAGLLAGMVVLTLLHWPYWIFIVFAILFMAFGAALIPPWLSFLSDLVQDDKRGAYFGWRSRNLGLVTVVTMILAGAILFFFEKFQPQYGFTVIFISGFICRLLSLSYLQKMYEPPLKFEKEYYFSIYEFFARMKYSNYAKFVMFVATMNFSVNLAAPFFSVLMLRDLHFNYLLYTSIITIAPLGLFLSMQRWGKHADRVGNLKIIKLTASIIAFIPILWLFNQNPVYLLAVELFSGFLWGGFNLCCANFIYDAVSPQKRTRCIAYFNVVNGVALFGGAIVGGWITHYLPAVLGFQIFTLFIISAVCRLVTAIIFPRFLKEVRPVEKMKSVDLFFNMIKMRPILGVDRTTARAQN